MVGAVGLGHGTKHVHDRRSKSLDRLHRHLALCQAAAMGHRQGGDWGARAIGRMDQGAEYRYIVGQ